MDMDSGRLPAPLFSQDKTDRCVRSRLPGPGVFDWECRLKERNCPFAPLLAGRDHSRSGAGSERLFLPFGAYAQLICGSGEHLAHASQVGMGGSASCGTDRIFPPVSLCAFSDGCAGRRGYRNRAGALGDRMGQGQSAEKRRDRRWERFRYALSGKGLYG